MIKGSVRDLDATLGNQNGARRMVFTPSSLRSGILSVIYPYSTVILAFGQNLEDIQETYDDRTNHSIQ